MLILSKTTLLALNLGNADMSRTTLTYPKWEDAVLSTAYLNILD